MINAVEEFFLISCFYGACNVEDFHVNLIDPNIKFGRLIHILSFSEFHYYFFVYFKIFVLSVFLLNNLFFLLT